MKLTTFGRMMEATEVNNVAQTAALMAGFRPRFLRELVSVPFRDGLIVDGTEQLQVFQGKASLRLLPTLIELMDGTRTVRELANAIPGARVEHVQNAISLMQSGGLLEHGTSHPGDEEASSHTRSFFRRFGASKGPHMRPKEEYARLSQTEVIIVCSKVAEQHGNRLRSMLINSGMNSVSVLSNIPADMIDKSRAQAVSPLIILLSSGTEDRDWTARFDDWCYQARFGWLRAALDYRNGYADLGPFFDGHVNACYRCFSSTHSSEAVRQFSTEDPQVADWCFWLGLVATEIVYLISGIGRLATGTQFLRYGLPHWNSYGLRWPRIPQCPRCRPVPRLDEEPNTKFRANGGIETAVVFEDYAGTQSRRFAVGREAGEQVTHTAPPYPSNQMAQSHRIELSGELVKLERSVLSLLQNVSPLAHKKVDLRALGSILMLTAGIRKMLPANLPSRWAATAGNLGSVELCVIANRVEGLAKGVYFYMPQEHALAQFERRCPGLPPEQWIGRSIPWSDAVFPEALVLFLGALGRVAQKYEEFAYRLIQFDAGAATSQFLLVARTLGISCHVATKWADDLCEDQLNLDPAREQCTGVTALCSQEAQTIVPTSEILVDSEVRSARKPAVSFINQSTQHVMSSLRDESRQVERALGRKPCRVSDELLVPGNMAAPQISLPTPAQGGRLLGDVLSTRRSVRKYPLQAVSLQQVGTILQSGSTGDASYYPDESAAGLPLTFLVLALHVEGLQRAVYAYDFHSHGLNYRRPAPTDRGLTELFIQDEFADAPVVFWITGNLAAAVARHGSFGHRQLLLRAGMAAHRLWMSAMATGLSGCIVAGLVLVAARDMLGLDGYKHASLLAVAAGASSLS